MADIFQTIPLFAWLVGYGLIINVMAFVAFQSDKYCAERAMRRISEATLLKLALVGGFVGAKVAQRLFRHKTRKEPFRTVLNGIVALHCAAVVLACGAIYFSDPVAFMTRMTSGLSLPSLSASTANAAPVARNPSRPCPERFICVPSR